MQDKILILDFGSQYTQLIARRVREIGVYCEIYPYYAPAEEIKNFQPKGIILSGSPESVGHDKSPTAPELVFTLGCPVLGLCYGMQTMAAQLGGQVESSSHREFGHAEVRLQGHCQLFENIKDDVNDQGRSILQVWMSHCDRVAKVPAGFQIVADSDGAPIAAMADDVKKFYGLQFHPEVTHTKQGEALLKRFVLEICGCQATWTTDHIMDQRLADLKQQLGQDRVLLALSGGVDSSVVAVLLHKIIGDRLTCVFVDTGLLRLNEADQVMKMFAQHLGVNVILVNAKDRFFAALTGVADPEEKRKIVGRLFIEIFEEESKKLSGIQWLAQGTIYPDVIESAAAKFDTAHVIKSHHNVGGLPKNMAFKLVEPLRDLFKDEVRKLGLALGLPYEMIYRHPFPGPGLVVRILGEAKEEYATILRHADAIFIEELRKHDLYHKVSQAFAVFLPVKSVGVTGDGRHYEYVIALRAVETIDFMTARWAYLPHEFLAHVSNRIINEVAHVSRVAYDISNKPPATIEWE